MEVEVEAKRHPFRFMFKFLVFVGILYAVGKFLAEQKAQFYGISESEARAKIETKLAPRMGEEKATEVADQIIPKLREKGVIKADAPEDAADAEDEPAADAHE